MTTNKTQSTAPDTVPIQRAENARRRCTCKVERIDVRMNAMAEEASLG